MNVKKFAVKKETIDIDVVITLSYDEAKKLRNILGDTKLRETYGFEFPTMLCEQISEVVVEIR